MNFTNSQTGILQSWIGSTNRRQKYRRSLARIFELLEEQGTAVGKPYVAPLEDKLYEIRVEQDTNIYRTIYFAYTGRRFILLHGFQKKSRKTPKKELNLAKQRMKGFLLAEDSFEEKQKQSSHEEGKTSQKGKKQ